MVDISQIPSEVAITFKRAPFSILNLVVKREDDKQRISLRFDLSHAIARDEHRPNRLQALRNELKHTPLAEHSTERIKEAASVGEHLHMQFRQIDDLIAKITAPDKYTFNPAPEEVPDIDPNDPKIMIARVTNPIPPEQLQSSYLALIGELRKLGVQMNASASDTSFSLNTGEKPDGKKSR